MNPVKAVLAATETTGSEFFVTEDRAFLLMEGHAGGEWTLQIKTPDDTWMDIADSSGGILFDDDGLQFFYGQAYLPYRLTGGTVGAQAWLISSRRAPGLQ